MADKVASEEQVDQTKAWATLGVLLAALMVVYGNTLYTTYTFWDNPKYSHGWLIPVFTLVLLWLRHEPIRRVSNAERWWGVGLLSFGLGFRLVFTYFPNMTPEMATFIPSVAGLFLLVGGWRTLRWAGPAIAFLIFMFPLPGFLDQHLLKPLQSVATLSSTYTLQTLGIAAHSEGNSIIANDVHMNVVEACSGLRMLTIFLALAVAITLVTDRPVWERIVIVASAVPIAVIVNSIRITITGIVHITLGKEMADRMFHDLMGWGMMPMALGLLYIEFQILSHLFVDDGPVGPVQLGIGIPRTPKRDQPVTTTST